MSGRPTPTDYAEALASAAITAATQATAHTDAVGFVAGNVAISADTARKVYALRYLTLAGIAILIYDLILTFPEELHYVWRRRISPRKLVYIVNRYGMVATMLYYLSVLFPFEIKSDAWTFTHLKPRAYIVTQRCQRSAVAILSIDVVLESMSCGVVIFRLYALWECNRRVMWAMAAGFTLAKLVLFPFAGVGIAALRDTISFVHSDHMRFCATDAAPLELIGVWIPAVIFDIYAFTLLLINALYRPRSENQRLFDILYHDGIVYFITTISMRSFNLIINLTAPRSLPILAVLFSSTIVTVAVSRSFLRLYSVIDIARSYGDPEYDRGRRGYSSESYELRGKHDSVISGESRKMSSFLSWR